MRFLRTGTAIVFAILFALPSLGFAQAINSGKDIRLLIVPLETSRERVEELLGAPIAGDNNYDTPKFRITIWYSGRSKKNSCNWGVPDGTVLRVYVSPKKRPSLSELGFEMSSFTRQRTENDEVWDYVDDLQGITIEVFKDAEEGSAEQVIFFDYLAPRNELDLRCPE